MEDRDSVFVPKDLSKIKTKFLFGLTRRQCLFFGLGAAVGLPVFFLLRKSVSSTAASMLMMGVMLPFFMFGIYEKNGQPLETVLRQMVETKWLRPRRRPYETDNTYAALEREMRLRKEVKALEEQAKNNFAQANRSLQERRPHERRARQLSARIVRPRRSHDRSYERRSRPQSRK